MNHVVMRGIWRVPSTYRESSHPFDVALSKAVTDCLQFIPDDRPSAQEVADFLKSARDKYKQEMKKGKQ